MIEIVLNIFFIIFAPLLFTGFINRVKAVWAGKKGPALLQQFYDFIRLMKKGEVISHTTSFIFKISPCIVMACIIFAGLLAPIFNHRSIIGFQGDFILFAYILALGKFWSIISALDTGSSFEGMGASRELTFGMLIEPAFFIIVSSLTLLAGKTSFSKILLFLRHDSAIYILIIILCVITLFIMMITESCRVPVDDPNTHLELTMIHEVMILDNSGCDLGFLMYANGLKMTIIGSIVANIVIPPGIGIGFSVFLFTIVFIIMGVLIGTIESLIARLRMSHVPQFIFIMTSIALIIMSIIVLSINGGIR